MTTIPLPPKPRVRELDLIDKVAVISGASRGIGLAIARNLASRGCSILGTCTSEAGAATLASTLDAATTELFAATARPRPASLQIQGLVADILSPDCAAVISAAVAASFAGRVDMFVNSACDPMPGTIGDTDPAAVHRSLLANVQTPVLIVDELVRRRFFRRRSRIVYLSSVRARQPWSEQLMYAAGKSAGESLCRTWAQAFGGKEERFSFMGGTTANAVSGGPPETGGV
ncbi:hypothetical protein VD0001_g7045 [Verticillium dahliae]|nr:hypothetical protein VD0001_g7045 [Verticillium dahliae]